MSATARPDQQYDVALDALPATYIFSSESVTEGHPDKVCDFIADSILDAHLAQDPRARVACEVLVKDGNVVLAGEITSEAKDVDYEAIVRRAIEEIGYVDANEAFHAAGVKVTVLLSQQSGHIAQGVDTGGAGDQGIMFGYATDETEELMPLPILLSHRLSRLIAEDRKAGRKAWLRPDAKTQVSVEYEGNTPVAVRTVLVSTQHAEDVSQEEIKAYVATDLVPRALGTWYRDDIEILVNPTGIFAIGGPSADAGVTGRKIIVDTYGGAGRHGGGAFSGKDPSKVDRSGAYFGRFVARQLVKAGLARKAEVQVAYAIGRAEPVSVRVDTFGTGDARAAEAYVRQNFDFRPNAIIERLGLRRPIYRTTTNYGHFGRTGLPWEA
ncbi:S-adenosylmethionine synthetase [Gemmatirosa kalamazoonensis]|uniref:Methionine adenosyltransferase n=1 Tax=Gemmatirosa kalamazoonensis TaxID=861299 RepID=W0RFL5_9BACT|nr:methionine adenosyltransferase [Gemmatirosa kalamazoonensis]AHG89135.1 S-adenosylmethionine synthetase [Gemmatirosa kalamazoonensis]